jgi:hypothetical protein
MLTLSSRVSNGGAADALASRPVSLADALREIRRNTDGHPYFPQSAIQFSLTRLPRTVAPQLVKAGLLPAPSSESVGENTAFGDVQFLDQLRIKFRKPLWLDLGGIAKGFAVDVAMATLRARGVREGTVSAGGDLRTMGPEPAQIWLRNPAHPPAGDNPSP